MPSAVRAPRQLRSAETYERMLDAAETVLEQKSFDEATVGEIAARAGVTIGAFYGRFSSKNALLVELEARMSAEFVALVDHALTPEVASGRALEQMLSDHYRMLVQLYQRRRSVARALVLRSHTDPALKRRLERLNSRNLPRLAQLVMERARIRHPDPARAIRFAFLAVRSVCREVILFHESWPGQKALAGAALADELTRLFLGYLGLTATRR